MGALVMAWRCMVCMAGVLWWEFEGCEEDSRELECRVLKPKQSKQEQTFMSSSLCAFFQG